MKSYGTHNIIYRSSSSSVWEQKEVQLKQSFLHHPFNQWSHHYLFLHVDTELILQVYFFLISQETYNGSLSLTTWNYGLNKTFFILNLLFFLDFCLCMTLTPALPTCSFLALQVEQMYGLQNYRLVWISALPLINYNLHISHINWWYMYLCLAILPGSCISLTSITWALGFQLWSPRLPL